MAMLYTTFDLWIPGISIMTLKGTNVNAELVIQSYRGSGYVDQLLSPLNLVFDAKEKFWCSNIFEATFRSNQQNLILSKDIKPSHFTLADTHSHSDSLSPSPSLSSHHTHTNIHTPMDARTPMHAHTLTPSRCRRRTWARSQMKPINSSVKRSHKIAAQ